MLIAVIDSEKSKTESGLEAAMEAAQRIGHRCVFANRGLEGIDLCRGTRPALVFCGIQLPDMSGFRVVKALKQEPDLAGVRLWLLSDEPTPLDDMWAAKHGVDGITNRNNEKLLAIIQGVGLPQPTPPIPATAAAPPKAARRPADTESVAAIVDLFIRFTGPMGALIAEDIKRKLGPGYTIERFVVSLAEHIDTKRKQEFLNMVIESRGRR